MKNINKTLVLFFFLVLNYCYSQHGADWITVSLEDNAAPEYKHRPWTHFKDLNNTLDKFLGTWEYNQGGHYFKITFYKYEDDEHSVMAAPHQTEDRIESHYEYRYNNVLKFESYTTNLSFVSSHILYDENTMSFGYQEPSLTSCDKARIGRLIITASWDANYQPILTWVRTTKSLTQTPVPCPDGSPQDETDFLVPDNMVLKKI